MLFRNLILTGVSLLLALSFWGVSFSAEYVGSEACLSCHPEQYNLFRDSGHPYKLRKITGVPFKAPLPKGYTWDDISYLIGGAYKKIRYIDKKGYIITAAKDGSPAPTQYNFEVGTWSNYHPGEKKPYNCGRCHTTGYKKEGHQDGMEGMIGTWAFPGIQCERCHGPASGHVKYYKTGAGEAVKLSVDKSAELCGQCHNRGGLNDKIIAKGGFIRHHEQYNELKGSANKKKAKFTCLKCHDPHKTARHTVTRCKKCHAKQKKAYKGTPMALMGVTCVNCHMPKATKSAWKYGPYEGDIRTHVFEINTDPGAEMFYKEGKKTYARGFVTVDFSCLSCHKGKTKEWALKEAKGFHKRGKK